MKISVITPSYNSAKFIRRAIESVLAQDYDHFEHIVVDGQSTDGTPQVLQQYPHLKYVSEPDEGQSDAMNKGFRMSTGEIIVYLNADDVLLPGAFRTVLPYFEKGADFVVGNVLVERPDGSTWLNRPGVGHMEMLRHWEPGAFCLNPSGYYYRRHIQQMVGGFSPHNALAMDLEFLLEASRVCTLTKISENQPLGKFSLRHESKTSLSKGPGKPWTPEDFLFLEKFIRALPGPDQENFRKDQSAGYAQKHIRQCLRTGPLPAGVSLILCTHNGAHLLRDTIPHVLRQAVPDHIPWEFILVNNASTDNSQQVVKSLWNIGTPLRIVEQPIPGLVHARQMGIAEARYEYISFIDDDNWISPDWVKRVYENFSAHPDMGICGGQTAAVCETPPPSWFENIKGAYAIGAQADQSGDITQTQPHVWGAGLCLRRFAYVQVTRLDFAPILTGRKGDVLLSGEDTELCYAIALCGWKIHYDADLTLQHYLPSFRLQWRYAERLYRGFGYSHAIFDLYLSKLRNKGKDHKKVQRKALRKLFVWSLWRLIHIFQAREGNPDYLQYLLYQSKCRFILGSGKKYKKYYEKISRFADACKAVRGQIH